VGIAAPQVGILRRLVAVQRFDKEGEPFEFFVNPEIVEMGDEWAVGGEGCLSVPEISGSVERAQSLVLRYRDAEFVEHTEHIEGFTAVIFQHEIDHLNGTLFIDKMLPEDELVEEELDEEVE
jgi:peptide deformylase